MTAGVYGIVDYVADKIYVGSAKNIEKRLSVHNCHLRKGKHPNRHLQSAHNIRGPLKSTTLLVCRPEDRAFYEQIAITAFRANAPDCGYNTRKIAESNEGCKRTEKHTAAMLEGLARRRQSGVPYSRPVSNNWSEGQKAALANRNRVEFADPIRGTSRRAAISKALTGKPKSESHRAALRAAWVKRRKS